MLRAKTRENYFQECLIHAVQAPWLKEEKDRRPPPMPDILKD